MEAKRRRVALVFGGRSAEHEVSLQSARNVAAALDPEKYELLLIGIDREGRWYLSESSLSLLNAEDPRLIALRAEGSARVALTPDGSEGALVVRGEGGLPALAQAAAGRVDLLFPVLHGPYGEDGSIQGLARLANLPCVGADILGSALCMDKDAAKRLLRDAGLAVAPFRVYSSEAEALASYAELCAALGSDLFIKPANLGSSVGISHAKDARGYENGIREAFCYDTKVVVETRIEGREIEVAVLGNETLEASVPGEILPAGDFYSYEAKYLDENGAALLIPASLSGTEEGELRKAAITACRALCVRGTARVDFFLEAGGRILVNEVNTIPGFTKISMYPKLWEASGLGYAALLDRLVDLAIEEYGRRNRLRTRPSL
jgi:D-alanine-D-alanine ligase